MNEANVAREKCFLKMYGKGWQPQAYPK